MNYILYINKKRENKYESKTADQSRESTGTGPFVKVSYKQHCKHLQHRHHLTEPSMALDFQKDTNRVEDGRQWDHFEICVRSPSGVLAAGLERPGSSQNRSEPDREKQGRLPHLQFFSRVLKRIFSTSQKWLELCVNSCQCIRTYI